jgi:uncharacterized protein (TIGR00255 family)
MTGFGQARVKSKATEYDLVVRAVNGRFLEVRFHVPREFMLVESEMKKVIERYFHRGTLDVYLSRKVRPELARSQVVINTHVVKAYVGGLKELNKLLGTKNLWHPESLLRMPEVISMSEKDFDLQAEKRFILQAAEEACKRCQKTKDREGQSLKKDLLKNHESLSQVVERVWTTRSEASDEIQNRINERIQSKVMQNRLESQIDPQRMAQEITLLLEKSDISEEINRLREHLRLYKQLLASDQPQGKTLDFYTQELLREVNTIGAKSHLSKLTQLVVEAKTLIERLREQVQNVE